MSSPCPVRSALIILFLYNKTEEESEKMDIVSITAFFDQ